MAAQNHRHRNWPPGAHMRPGTHSVTDVFTRSAWHLSLAHPAIHWCHRPQVIWEEKVSFGAVGGVIRVINCRGAVKSVLLKTLRRSEYRPAKSASRPKCARRASDIHISSRKQYINLSLLGGILGQNLKNQSRRSNSVRTSLDPKWPAKSIYAIAGSYGQVILYVNWVRIWFRYHMDAWASVRIRNTEYLLVDRATL